MGNEMNCAIRVLMLMGGDDVRDSVGTPVRLARAGSRAG